MLDNEQLPTVPLAAFEAAQARHARTLRRLCLGWLASVAILAAAVIFALIG